MGRAKFLKKYRILMLAAGLSLLFLGGMGLLTCNYINGAVDYKKTLAVNNERAGIVSDTGTADISASSSELEKARAEVDRLHNIEREEGLAGYTYGDNNFETSIISEEITSLDGYSTAGTGAIIPAAHKSNVVNILLLGLDRDLARDKTLGVYRTDSISIASINLDIKKIKVLSIPRDTYVYIPVCGKMDKINTAYVWGGMGSKGIKSAIAVVNKFVKYDTIDYYFCIDMEPIPKIVDDLGGVGIDIDMDLTGDLKKGYQVLDGNKSLVYLRYRYTPNGDIDRIRHQQMFCTEMLRKMKDKDQLLADIKIVLSYSKYIKTNLNMTQLVSLGSLASGIKAGDISCDIVPGRNVKINSMWYWIADSSKTDSLLKNVFGIN